MEEDGHDIFSGCLFNELCAQITQKCFKLESPVLALYDLHTKQGPQQTDVIQLNFLK